MASLVKLATNAIKYTDDNGYEMRIAIPHIINWFDYGKNQVCIKTVDGKHRFTLDDQAAVNAAITLIENNI